MTPRTRATTMPIPYEASYEAREAGEDETGRALIKTLLEISDTTFQK